MYIRCVALAVAVAFCCWQTTPTTRELTTQASSSIRRSPQLPQRLSPVRNSLAFTQIILQRKHITVHTLMPVSSNHLRHAMPVLRFECVSGLSGYWPIIALGTLFTDLISTGYTLIPDTHSNRDTGNNYTL